MELLQYQAPHLKIQMREHLTNQGEDMIVPNYHTTILVKNKIVFLL